MNQKKMPNPGDCSW